MYKINLIGSGKVATHLAKAFIQAGHELKGVYSKTFQNAKELADQTGSRAYEKIDDLSQEVDVWIVSVKDDAINEIADKLNVGNALVVHTAGSVNVNIFKRFNNYGVFYPLQTFSKTKTVDFSNIPLLLEANSSTNLELLMKLGTSISENCREVNSEQRKKVHIAAVFACNFTNYMFSLSEQVLKENNLDFDLLKPLISETIEKAMEIGPQNAQTGPAIRNDVNVIENHLHLLESNPKLKDLYSYLSSSIFEFFKKNEKQRT